MTEGKVWHRPHVIPPTDQLMTLYHHPMLEMCQCSSAAHALCSLGSLSSPLQEMFAFMNKNSLRQYIHKVRYLPIKVSIPFSFASDDIVRRRCSCGYEWTITLACICSRTSSTVLVQSRMRWPTTSMSYSQLLWITWNIAWEHLWTVTARWAQSVDHCERKPPVWHNIFKYLISRLPTFLNCS